MSCRILGKLCVSAVMAAYAFALFYDAVMDWVDGHKYAG
jgi:hypothetical protein